MAGFTNNRTPQPANPSMNFYNHGNAQYLPTGTSSGFTQDPTFGAVGTPQTDGIGTSAGFTVDPTFGNNTATNHPTQGTGAPASFTPDPAFAGLVPPAGPDPLTDPKMGRDGTKDPNATGGQVIYEDPTGGAGSSGPETPGAPLADPGYQEDWYKTYGQDLMKDRSASEDLYSKGSAGSNPFYDYAQEQATKAINDAAAARGGFNSSFTMKTIGNAVSDLRGQQAHELGMLAGQADQGKFGRYDRGNQFSGDAQRAMENRARGGIQSDLDLAGGQAGLVGGFYGEAGRENMTAQLANIEVMLKKSGMSAAQIQQAMNMFMQSLGMAGQAFGGVGGGGGGGSTDPAKV